MKKNKITTENEMRSIAGDKEWERVYWARSPLKAINTPDRTLFVTTSGCANFGYYSGPSIQVFGMDICRYDWKDEPSWLNFDHYPVLSTDDPDLFHIVGPQEPSYHHSTGIPKGFNVGWSDIIEDTIGLYK